MNIILKISFPLFLKAICHPGGSKSERRMRPPFSYWLYSRCTATNRRHARAVDSDWTRPACGANSALLLGSAESVVGGSRT
jgi:hypothetical protein